MLPALVHLAAPVASQHFILQKFIEQNDISFCNALAAMSLAGAQTLLGDIAVKGASPQLNEPLYSRPECTVV